MSPPSLNPVWYLGLSADERHLVNEVMGWPEQTQEVFYLHFCALLDVEPWGERAITGMCHTIEDATFDPTAQVVNPKAHVRHVHRPPRMPADRVPHCRWEVTIDDANETLEEAPITTMTRGTTAATFQFPPMRDGTPHLPPTATPVQIG